MMRSAAVATVAVAAILLSAPVVASATCTGDASWTAMTMLNGWVGYGGSYASGQYRRDAVGFVHLSGEIKSGTLASTMTVLPAGYRPATNLDSLVLSSGSSGSLLVVKPDGTVTVSGGGNAYVSLEGVSFYAGPDCTGGSGGTGMTDPMTTAQDLIVGGVAGAPGRLGVGTSGQVLSVDSSGVVAWASAASTSFNLSSFTGDALATVNQAYSLVLVIGALLVLGVGYTIASGLRK